MKLVTISLCTIKQIIIKESNSFNDQISTCKFPKLTFSCPKSTK